MGSQVPNPGPGKVRESVVVEEAREVPQPRFLVPADEEVRGPELIGRGA
jgi:hypothetical protein